MPTKRINLSFDMTPTPINLSDIYVEVAQREGGAVNLPIAQISETCARFVDILAEHCDVDRRFGLNLIAMLDTRAEELIRNRADDPDMPAINRQQV